MDQTRFGQSMQGWARFTGRRDAVRSLGAMGTAVLAVLGLADATSAAQRRHTGGIGGGRGRKNRSKVDFRARNGARKNAGEKGPQTAGDDVPAVSDGTAPQRLTPSGSVHADRKKKKKCAKGCSTRTRRPPVVREGTGDAGAGFINSQAFCNPGEHAVSGGYLLFNVDWATFVQMENVPIDNEAGVPIGWSAGIQTSGANTAIAARVLCVAD
jgi:hypothetical protein